MKLGCSQSTSLVAEATLYLDAEAALNYVQQESLREEARVSIARPDSNRPHSSLRANGFVISSSLLSSFHRIPRTLPTMLVFTP